MATFDVSISLYGSGVAAQNRPKVGINVSQYVAHIFPVFALVYAFVMARPTHAL